MTAIGKSAFRESGNLSKVVLPATITSIGSYAFYYCIALTDVYCSGVVPPTCYSPGETFSFAALYSATLHVPDEALTTFGSTQPWGSFGNIVGGVEAETFFVPTHRPVYEEYTGMWCGYCPRGAVWMAIMKDLYPDDWIGISYHYNDDLQMLNTSDFPMVISCYPSGYFDRQGSNYTSSLESPWQSRCIVEAPANIELDAMLDADGENILCTAEVVFSKDAVGDNYEVEFILVADSLYKDNWYQKNFYAVGTVTGYEGY